MARCRTLLIIPAMRSIKPFMMSGLRDLSPIQNGAMRSGFGRKKKQRKLLVSPQRNKLSPLKLHPQNR